MNDRIYYVSDFLKLSDINDLSNIADKAILLPSEKISVNTNLNLIKYILKINDESWINAAECDRIMTALNVVNSTLQIAEYRNLKFPAQPLEFH